MEEDEVSSSSVNCLPSFYLLEVKQLVPALRSETKYGPFDGVAV